MSDSSSDCPSNSRLASVLQGEASEDEVALVMQHLDHCEKCIAALDQITGPSVVDRLMESHGSAESSPRGSSHSGRDPQRIEEAERIFVDRLKKSFRFLTPVSIGPYKVVRKVGQGMMGEVFECEPPDSGRSVALKTIRNHVLSPVLVTRISQEARMLAGLDHPNIVKLHEFGITVDGMPFLAMEFVGGGNLSAKIRKERLRPRQAAELVRQCSAALAHAHTKGVLHRDLKPSNILLEESEKENGFDGKGTLIPKIADFGLARYFEGETHVTQSGSLVGTPGYMSPEQIHSGSRLGPETDIYALGAILYETITGSPPFQAPSLAGVLRKIQEEAPSPPRGVEPSIPRDLEIICLKCLEKRPEDRYVSAADLEADLQRFLDGEAVLARPLPLLVRWKRWCERNRRLAASLIFSTVVLIVSAIGGILFGIEQSRLVRISNSATENAKAERMSALNSASVAEAALEEAVRQKALAEEERDLAVVLMDRSTSALYHAFLATRSSGFENSPEIRQLRGFLARNFFETATDAKKIRHMERDKPDYLLGLLYKAGVLQWELGERNAAPHQFREVLRIFDGMPPHLREVDGVCSQVISARKVLGQSELDRNGPEAGISAWTKNWDTWFARGEDWLTRYPYAVDMLADQGRVLVGALENFEKWDEFRRIEPQLKIVEGIARKQRAERDRRRPEPRPSPKPESDTDATNQVVEE